MDDIIYRTWLDDLDQHAPNVSVRYSLTRQQSPGWVGYSRRIDPAMLQECLDELATLNGHVAAPLCYVCGPTGFVETAADALLEVGIPESVIRTERFGPTS